MKPVVYIVALITFFATLGGGFFALRFRDRTHKILGFVAGVLLGVVAFELLPEIFELVHTSGFGAVWPMIALLAGFLTFHIVEKLSAMHGAHEDEYGKHSHRILGKFSATGLVLHSLFDGLSIGLGFQINPQLGLVIALAVIAHDFTDGFNTVSIMLRHKNSTRAAKLFLIADAIAPVIGVFLASIWQVPAWFLVLYLGFFAGFLLYLSAADILPEAHSKHPSKITLLLTVLGILFVLLITRVLT